MDEIRVGIIGLGTIGSGVHLPNWLKMKNARVVALCDNRADQLQTLSEKFNIKKTYLNYEELLDSDDIDAVDVCLPVYLHAPVSIAALKKGKHVLCEKPLARTSAEAREMANAAAESGKILMMAVNNRYRPESQLLKAKIEAGDLGKIYHAKAAWVRRRTTPWGADGWYMDRSRSGGGALIDCGVHGLDLMWWLMGTPEPVSVSAATYWEIGTPEIPGDNGADGIEEFATAFIRFANGASAEVNAAWNLHLKEEIIKYVKIYGNRGGAELPPLALYHTEQGFPMNSYPQYQEVTNYEMEIAHFVNCVLEGKQPISPAIQGITVIRMVEAAYESARLGREVQIAKDH